MSAIKETWNQLGLCFKPPHRDMGGVRAVAKHIQRRVLLAQSHVQWSWVGGIKICLEDWQNNRYIGFFPIVINILESKNYLKASVGKKEPTSLHSNTDKVCLSPSPQLLQQSVELLITLRALTGPLRASSERRAEVHMEMLSVRWCSYLCLWWVLILMWTTDHWLNPLPYCW